MNVVLGAIVGLGLALLIISNEDSDVIDEIGDWLATLTTSEQTRLDQLEPGTRDMVQQLLLASQAAGAPLYVGQTRRTPAQEKKLKAAGKTSQSLTVSWHELGRAVDLYPLTSAGSPDYDGADLDGFRTFQGIAVSMGFRSLAFNDDGSKHLITNSKGKKIWDGGHVEWRDPYDSIGAAVASEGTDEQKARLA
jgi:hypothetical protein